MPSAEDAATLQAHWTGADEAARRAEAKWGVGRLPTLVPTELRAKFERQRARLSAAYDVAWSSPMLTRDQLDAVIKAAGAMERAWEALDAAATAAAAAPISATVWEVATDDGRVIAVVRTGAEVAAVPDRERYRWVYTLAEVAQAVKLLEDGSGGLVDGVKQAFPGATMKIGKFEPSREIPF